MPPNALPGSLAARDERIDALRGFALLGILLVNIQSFLYGAANPIGYIGPDAGLLDRASLFATAAFVNLKFMPLFAMLFGAGFSFLYAKLQSLTSTPKRIYRRRMFFLFVFGMLHGIFLYFGDITQMYAVAGLVLLLYVERGVPALGRAAAYWWAANAALAGALFVWIGTDSTLSPDTVAEVERNFEVFSRGTYLEQLPLRIDAFGELIVGNLFGLPMTVALMLTGTLAHRAGWLADLGAPAWRTARMLGLLVGLPAALFYGYSMLSMVEADGLAATPQAAAIPMALSVALAFFYAAVFLQRTPQRWISFFSPAGRMPLTNYLFQSIAMGALLSGWGLSLGPRLSYWQTAALGVMIFAFQVLLSRLWLGPLKMKQGPLEALWRAWTYRGLSTPRSTGASTSA